MGPFPKTTASDYSHKLPSSFMSTEHFLMIALSAIIMIIVFKIFTDMRAKRRENARSVPFEQRSKLSEIIHEREKDTL